MWIKWLCHHKVSDFSTAFRFEKRAPGVPMFLFSVHFSQSKLYLCWVSLTMKHNSHLSFNRNLNWSETTKKLPVLRCRSLTERNENVLTWNDFSVRDTDTDQIPRSNCSFHFVELKLGWVQIDIKVIHAIMSCSEVCIGFFLARIDNEEHTWHFYVNKSNEEPRQVFGS